MKKISVIIPMYNCENTILELIDSILSQSYKNYEVILVNDGSTDATLTVLEPILSEMSNIILVNQENQGAPIARNNGMNHAKGDYILFCDSDDIFYPKSFEKLIECAMRENSDIVIGTKVDFKANSEENTKSQITLKKRFEWLKDRKYVVCDPVPGNKLFKRSFLKSNEIEFSNVRIGQDLSFYLKSCFSNAKISIIPDEVYKYRIRENSVSRTYKLDTIIDIKKSIHSIYGYLDKTKNEDYDLLEMIKMTNYLYQLRKVDNLTKQDYKILKKELFGDVNVLRHLRINFLIPFSIVLVEYFLCKCFDVILRKVN